MWLKMALRIMEARNYQDCPKKKVKIRSHSFLSCQTLFDLLHSRTMFECVSTKRVTSLLLISCVCVRGAFKHGIRALGGAWDHPRDIATLRHFRNRTTYFWYITLHWMRAVLSSRIFSAPRMPREERLKRTKFTRLPESTGIILASSTRLGF